MLYTIQQSRSLHYVHKMCDGVQESKNTITSQTGRHHFK